MIRLTDQVARLSPFARRLFNPFWAVAGAVSVRTKILGIVLTLVLMLGVGVTFQVRSTFRTALGRELHNRGVSVARDVAAGSVDLILVRDLYGVYQLLQDTLANNKDVRYAFVVGPDGDILAHTFGDGFPPALVGVNTAATVERYRLQQITTDEGIIWDFAVPILEGEVGVARVGLSEQAMRATLSHVTRQLLVTTIIVSLAGVAAAILLTWLITRPVLDLVEVTRTVARGDLSHAATHWANDEIGLLSDSFNAMITDLAAARAESEAFDAELLRRNRELAALNEVSRAVSGQQDLVDMLDGALRRVLALMDLEAGWVVLLEPEGTHARLVCSVGIPVPVARQEAETGFPHCQCGRVLEEKTSLLITSLDETCPVHGLCVAGERPVTSKRTSFESSLVMSSLRMPRRRPAATIRLARFERANSRSPYSFVTKFVCDFDSQRTRSASNGVGRDEILILGRDATARLVALTMRSAWRAHTALSRGGTMRDSFPTRAEAFAIASRLVDAPTLVQS